MEELSVELYSMVACLERVCALLVAASHHSLLHDAVDGRRLRHLRPLPHQIG